MPSHIDHYVMQYYKYSPENEKFLSIAWFYREKYTHLPQSAPTRERQKKVIIQMNFNNTNLNFWSSRTISSPIFNVLPVASPWILNLNKDIFSPFFSGNCSLYDNYDNEWSENMRTFNLIREPQSISFRLLFNVNQKVYLHFYLQMEKRFETH